MKGFADNSEVTGALPTSIVDAILTAQLVVAYAGEGGEDARLGWWRTDLVSEFGGQDLFQRMLPNSWAWAVLESAREAARRHDASLRAQDHNADRLLSLFSLGFALDERVNERLADLKRAGQSPQQALPVLAELIQEEWNQDAFVAWLEGHARVESVAAPVGRRIKAAPPASPEALVSQLVAGLLPLSESYPLPHFRRAM